MPTYWMISDRTVLADGFGVERGPLTYWTADKVPLDDFSNWTKVSANDFKTLLITAADQFPAIPPGQNENQKHVTFLVHGYNDGWKAAAQLYEKTCSGLFSGSDSLGLCISFDWPSYGNILGYYPDRAHARECAADLTEVLSELYDWLLVKQQATVKNPADACKAKVSLIAHSMGNYVTQKAMATAWTRKNQPLLVTLINQLVMVAADVDNDLFEPSSADAKDGAALANLCYRITALYSGRDAVLGSSAGLKHFGIRRLGRSGLAIRPPSGFDNVWDVDCSSFFPGSVDGLHIHGAYFVTPGTVTLMRDLLRGLDRTVLETLGRTRSNAWP
jgi:esterase/lipase superfamily enzyme